ncbi:MAG: phosphatidate cytidylyltransferase [Desulfuromonadaceae bacterium]|nr:phosphatidate cytidylyltransferase [Desulfuromonas sp.]MDY0184702.1 phosphatidate cytidylyltransferase [Desulfuromonadaceae bacterium]
MLRDRIVTALVALPLVVFLTLFAGTGIFFTVAVGVVVLAVLECLHLFRPQADIEVKLLVVFGGVLLFSVACWSPDRFGVACSGVFLLLALFYLLRFKDIVLVINDCAAVLLIWIYIPMLLSYMVLLHALPEGHKLVFLVFLMTMLCDSCAYFVGTRWGKHRLYPAVSPKKSVEGAVGGVGGAVLAVVGSMWLFMPELSLVVGVGLGVLVGIFAQIGDLFESLLKRSAQIKDSGHLFPGHGGMLDRLDSLLFSFPVAYLYFQLVL